MQCDNVNVISECLLIWQPPSLHPSPPIVASHSGLSHSVEDFPEKKDQQRGVWGFEGEVWSARECVWGSVDIEPLHKHLDVDQTPDPP